MPSELNSWEIEATFNGCPIKENDQIHLFYRAISAPRDVDGNHLRISTIGYAKSNKGLIYKDRKQLIFPEYDWEKYGCEDPRVTKMNDTYYIFYTALSTFPFGPEGIKVGLAKTKDFQKFEKYPVTNFNSKAMALFSEKINGKFCTVLSVDTDRSASKICLAFFDREEEIYSSEYWDAWYKSCSFSQLELDLDENDHCEVGAPPIKTDKGWLLIYSHMKNYYDPNNKTIFQIRAMLLDLKDSFKVVGYTSFPLLVPEKEYELYGQEPDILPMGK